MNSRAALRGIAVGAVIALTAGCLWADDAPRKSRRRTTPITNAATTTQAVNETRNDTARINAARRAASTHYHREDGAIVYVDTVTGEEWIDSAAIRTIPKMKYPLLVDATVGVDIWDPVMRLFGQKHGIIGFWGSLNMHNRYFPAFEIGLGTARKTPVEKDFTYSSPTSVYFRIGADYNFLYNSNPDYKWFAGLRYGFSSFKWSIDHAAPSPGYWGDVPPFAMTGIGSTVGWIEVGIGLRVRLFGNISAGWMVKFHSLLHQSKNVHGEPWYIPGFGSRGQSITGSFSISYTIPFNKRPSPQVIKEDTVTQADLH